MHALEGPAWPKKNLCLTERAVYQPGKALFRSDHYLCWSETTVFPFKRAL